MTESKRRTVSISPVASQLLDEIVSETGGTANHEINRAIEDRHWLINLVRSGNKILIETPDGKMQVVFYRIT